MQSPYNRPNSAPSRFSPSAGFSSLSSFSFDAAKPAALTRKVAPASPCGSPTKAQPILEADVEETFGVPRGHPALMLRARIGSALTRPRFHFQKSSWCRAYSDSATNNDKEECSPENNRQPSAHYQQPAVKRPSSAASSIGGNRISGGGPASFTLKPVARPASASLRQAQAELEELLREEGAAIMRNRQLQEKQPAAADSVVALSAAPCPPFDALSDAIVPLLERPTQATGTPWASKPSMSPPDAVGCTTDVAVPADAAQHKKSAPATSCASKYSKKYQQKLEDALKQQYQQKLEDALKQQYQQKLEDALKQQFVPSQRAAAQQPSQTSPAFVPPRVDGFDEAVRKVMTMQIRGVEDVPPRSLEVSEQPNRDEASSVAHDVMNEFNRRAADQKSDDSTSKLHQSTNEEIDGGVDLPAVPNCITSFLELHFYSMEHLRDEYHATLSGSPCR